MTAQSSTLPRPASPGRARTPRRRGLRLVVLAVVLAVLPIALPPSVAQAVAGPGSLSTPSGALLLAEYGALEAGGVIAGTGTAAVGASVAATTAAGVSGSAGAASSMVAVGTAGGVTVIGGPSAASVAATGGAAVVASVGGFFGLKALFGGADAQGTEWKPGGSDANSPGWEGSYTPHTWGLQNVPQFYPEVDGRVAVSGGEGSVLVQIDFPGGDPKRNDRPQDVAVEVYGSIENPNGEKVEKSVGFLDIFYGHSTVTSFQAGDALAGGILRAITRVVVSSAPTRGGALVPSGVWRPVQESSKVQVVVTANCSDGTTITKASDLVTANGRGELPIPDAVCRPGSVMVGSKGVLNTISSAGTAVDVLWDWLAPDWVPKMPGDFPACFAAGASCVLEPRKNMPDGSVQSCFAAPGLCTDWIPKQKAGDTSVQCWFGPYRVAVERCYAYPNPGVSPIVPTADPSGKPRAPTSTPTTPGDSPTPGTAGNPAPGDAEGNRCFPSGWGMLNPLQWVYQPVKCALVWAFVPSSSGAERVGQLQATFTAKPPFSVVWPLATGVAGLFEGWSGKCEHMPFFTSSQLRAQAGDPGMGQALCAPPDSSVWRAVYGLARIGIVVVTVLILYRWVVASFGKPVMDE